MKIRKGLLRFAAITMAAVVLLSMIPALSATAAQRNYKKQDIKTHLFGLNSNDTVSCLIYDDMPSMPYISITDYLGEVFEDRFKLSETGSGVFTVISPTKKTMVIDTAKNIVRFDDFEHFIPTQAEEVESNEAPYLKSHTLTFHGNINGLTLDYGKYNIDITSSEGSVYFPLNTLSNLFSDTYLSAVYMNGEIYFIQSTDDASFDNTEAFKYTLRSADLIDYSYRELCFMMDNYFGRPAKSPLSKLINESSGFDNMMNNTEFGKTVKPLIMSKSVTDYYTGLILIDSLLDDGGHSSLSVEYTKAMIDKPNSPFGAEAAAMLNDPVNPNSSVIAENFKTFMETLKSKEEFGKFRAEQYSKYETVKTLINEKSEDKELIAQLVMWGDTAVFVFDDFRDEVIAPFKRSLDYAKEKGAKNFVIDLSNNSGGSSAVLMYMLCIMTGTCDMYVTNTLTGNMFVESGKVDKNLDGVIDENGNEVDYDFRFALLTTKRSFSCANYLSVLAQEKLIPVLGETSGGGTCFILNDTAPNALGYSLSGFKKMVDKNGNDVDGGAKVNYETVTAGADGKSDYSKLYDIKAVSSYLDDYYSKVTPIKVKTDYTSSFSFTAIKTVIFIAVPVILVAAAFVIILLVIRKKRRNAGK